MGRWAPDARQRLVVAAVDLFGEQGYDATTVQEIAERAGVTRSTFFRHFGDKRELLTAGQAVLSGRDALRHQVAQHGLMAEGIAAAPDGATPLAAVAAGLLRASSAMGPVNHDLGPRLEAVVATSEELQERSLLKEAGLAAAMTAALTARRVPEATARLAAEMGVLAFSRGFASWVRGPRDDADELAGSVAAALEELRTAAAAIA